MHAVSNNRLYDFPQCTTFLTIIFLHPEVNNVTEQHRNGPHAVFYFVFFNYECRMRRSSKILLSNLLKYRHPSTIFLHPTRLRTNLTTLFRPEETLSGIPKRLASTEGLICLFSRWGCCWWWLWWGKKQSPVFLVLGWVVGLWHAQSRIVFCKVCYFARLWKHGYKHGSWPHGYFAYG